MRTSVNFVRAEKSAPGFRQSTVPTRVPAAASAFLLFWLPLRGLVRHVQIGNSVCGASFASCICAVAGYRIGERDTDLIGLCGFPETAAIFRSCASM